MKQAEQQVLMKMQLDRAKALHSVAREKRKNPTENDTSTTIIELQRDMDAENAAKIHAKVNALDKVVAGQQDDPQANGVTMLG